jgi:hypothetical protein
MSAAGRARIAAAQRARWAKQKATGKQMKNVVFAIIFWMVGIVFFCLVHIALQKGQVRYFGSPRIIRKESPFRFWLGITALFLGALFLIISGFMVLRSK